jgi:hypothetical protein
MARSRITDTDRKDLISDAGSVLFSLVQGEQLEFPVTLNFVEDATDNYAYEAVLVEAENVARQISKPKTALTGGVQDTIVVRVPTNRGNWQDVQAYNREEIVKYNNLHYKLLEGAGRINATTPDLDPAWEVTLLNKIYLQFPKTLSLSYTVQPTVDSPSYGFFELRVTEPLDSIYSRTWKPIRGMVEFLFSPTQIVPDV